MKRYQIEASTFELDGTESHTVLYTSNGISTARAYLEGFTTASDWKDHDLVNLLDTAHPNDSDLHLIDSKMHEGSFLESKEHFTVVAGGTVLL